MLTIDRVAEVFGVNVAMIFGALCFGFILLGNYLFGEKKQSS